MGHKLLKQHYRIEHIVQVRDGVICIGSSYVSEIITIKDYKPKWASGLGESRNDDLARYFSEMSVDPAKLREVIDAPDTFETSITVWTYEDGEIIEKKCEALGWPNVTHDGCLMYENTFSTDKQKVIRWAKKNTQCGIEMVEERLEEDRAKALKTEATLAKYRADLEKLESDYPE